MENENKIYYTNDYKIIEENNKRESSLFDSILIVIGCIVGIPIIFFIISLILYFIFGIIMIG